MGILQVSPQFQGETIRKSMEKSGILVWAFATIILALVLGSIKIGDAHPVLQGVGRTFAIFLTLFSQFLSFAIPLTIIGLVTSVIVGLGRGAGKWLGVAIAIAYGSTLFSGFLTYSVCVMIFPKTLQGGLTDVAEPGSALEAYFTAEMPAAVPVMITLLLSFVAGIGLAVVLRGVLRKGFIKFRAIITKFIEHIIIPPLSLHIFGIFLNLTYTGEAWTVVRTLARMVIAVLILEVIILLSQYLIVGMIGKKNPIKSLPTTMPAYLTTLGTSSSTATIPVILRQTKGDGISNSVASFTVPLCTIIHLVGSTLKIFAFAFAIAFTQRIDATLVQWVGFVLMLGITMIAAPGVPGGAIMATTGLLPSMLGFNDTQVVLMIATYITFDSFGTATSATGDDATAIAVDRFADGRTDVEDNPENACELSFDGMRYLDKASVEGLTSIEELKASVTQTGENAVSN